jgi:hypothetical protein
MTGGTLSWAAVALALGVVHSDADAAALLRCDVTYAGSTQTIEARPVAAQVRHFLHVSL